MDDKKENLIALIKILRDQDINIETAQSGQEAMSLVVRKDFSVILLDVQMPDLDGFQTATLIQSNESSRHVPIIFVTA